MLTAWRPTVARVGLLKVTEWAQIWIGTGTASARAGRAVSDGEALDLLPHFVGCCIHQGNPTLVRWKREGRKRELRVLVRGRHTPLSTVSLEFGHELVGPECRLKPLARVCLCPSIAVETMTGGGVDQDASCAEGGRKHLDRGLGRHLVPVVIQVRRCRGRRNRRRRRRGRRWGRWQRRRRRRWSQRRCRRLLLLRWRRRWVQRRRRGRRQRRRWRQQGRVWRERRGREGRSRHAQWHRRSWLRLFTHR